MNLNKLAFTLGLALCALLPQTYAATLNPETIQLQTEGNPLEVQRFGSTTASTQLLILAQEAKPQNLPLASALADAGLGVWLAQPKTDLVKLLSALIPENKAQTFYVMALGQQTEPTLKALQTLEKQKPERYNKLGGLLLAYPEVKLSNLNAKFVKPLPSYIFQPAHGSESTSDLVKSLVQAGYSISVKQVADVEAGFLEQNQLSEDAMMQVAIFPSLLMEAIAYLESKQNQPKQHNASKEKASQKSELKSYSGQIAPELKLEDLDRKLHDLKTYQGKVVVLNFWATWCPPCVKELPSLNRLQQQFSKDDLVVLGVNMSEGADEVADFLDKFTVDYPNLIDAKEQVAKTWKLRAFPTTLVIDQKGAIRLGYEGGLEWDAPDIIQTLEQQFAIKALPAQTVKN